MVITFTANLKQPKLIWEESLNEDYLVQPRLGCVHFPVGTVLVTVIDVGGIILRPWALGCMRIEKAEEMS